MSAATTRFTVPPGRSADRPPESRGLRRDEVRLLVADGTAVHHARFRELGRFLAAGDLVVVNTSGTLAAAVDTGTVVVHFSAPLPDGTWIVELRRPDQSGPVRDAVAGARIALPAGGILTLLANRPASDRLWQARANVPLGAYLARYGRPIAYGYLHGRYPLPAYQTAFAREPGSAEMPSAGRPFTPELVTGLVAAGVVVAPVTLHTGVSSAQSGEPPQPERFRVPAHTADLVDWARGRGGRVVAVGTTVVRALESAARRDGSVGAAAGWTNLVLGPDRPARVVTGLVTGLHEPQASHLLLLESVAGPDLVQRAYDAAVTHRYLWHEFGDSCLLLPATEAPAGPRE
jgi:S-adenosylmethionine:tRNA ribosyltransferase-isomerase